MKDHESQNEFSVRCVYCKNEFKWNINIFTRAGARETRISGTFFSDNRYKVTNMYVCLKCNFVFKTV